MPEPSLADMVDIFTEEFEAAWADGLAPRIEEHLPSPKYAGYLAALVELACIDMERRWARGDRPSLEEYFRRFPLLKEDTPARGQLVFEDYRQRLLAGLAPQTDDYQERFGVDVAEWPNEVASALVPAGSRRCDPNPFENAGQTRRIPVVTDPGLTRSGRPSLADQLDKAMTQLPRVGQELLGFHLLHELGRGAFGIVFLARQGDLAHRLVALKVSADLSGESDRLAQLQHTNIVPIYSAHRSGGLQAICMPYFGCATVADLCVTLSGQRVLPTSGRYIVSTMQDRQSTIPTSNLKAEIQKPQSEMSNGLVSDCGIRIADFSELTGIGKMSYVDAVLWMASRLADGLAHAHARGIIHRDLKPANILLTDDGQPMLLDFNLAEDVKLRESAVAAHMGGTLPYMSPEQLASFRGNRIALDGRSDVYSLGLILYQLLTGRSAFPSHKGSTYEVLPKMLEDRQGPAPRLRPYNPAVSPAVNSIIRHCLEPDPQRRYSSARALKEDIDRQLANLPLRYAPEPSWQERARKWARRHPRLVSPLALAMAGAAVLLLAVSCTVALSLEGRKRQLDARRETAVVQYTAFQQQFREAELLLSNDDPEQIRQGLRAGLDVLEPFGVLEDPDWQSRPTVGDLPPADRLRLIGEVGELAYLLARAFGDKEGQDQARLLHNLAGACLGNWATEDKETGGQGDKEKSDQRSFLLACQHTTHGHYREALQILTGVVRAAPNQYGGWYLKGRCHEALGQTDEALACYGTCIVLRPDFARPYMARAAVAYNNQRDLHQARADLDQALRLDPGQQVAHIDRSLVLGALRRDREALADLDRVLADPRAPTRVYFLRASVRERLGDAEGGRLDRSEGLKREPGDVVSWITRGVARAASDPAGALADFRQAEKLNPRSADALMNQAYILGEVWKKNHEALNVLDRLVKNQPDHLVGRASRGVLLARLGRIDEAVAEAKTCLAANPGPETRYRTACIYALASAAVRPGAGVDPTLLRESQRLLAGALLQGWGFEYVQQDDDLAPLRKQAGFSQLLEVVELLQTWKK